MVRAWEALKNAQFMSFSHFVGCCKKISVIGVGGVATKIKTTDGFHFCLFPPSFPCFQIPQKSEKGIIPSPSKIPWLDSSSIQADTESIDFQGDVLGK